MDDMSWFGVVYYIVLFTAVYVAVNACIWVYEWMKDRDYKEGYADGFADGSDDGFMNGQHYRWQEGYAAAMIDMDYGQKSGIKHMKIKRVNMLDEDTIGIDLEEE